MGRKESSSTGPLDVANAAEDGRFEILVDDTDDPRRSPVSQPGTSDGNKRTRLIAAVSVIALLLIGVTGVAALFGGEPEDDVAEGQDLALDEEPGFQPYAGGLVASDDEPTDDDPSPAALAASDHLEREQEPDEAGSSDEGESEQDRVAEQGYDREADWRIDETSVIGREPDGERIIEDTRGEPMSQREAQERLERQLESIENADRDYQQRLRRRDARVNSRVIRSIGEDGVTIAPGVQISEDIQKRIQEQFGRNHVQSVELEDGVEADEYRGVEDYDDDYYYDDDDYYDDEYWDDADDWDEY